MAWLCNSKLEDAIPGTSYIFEKKTAKGPAGGWGLLGWDFGRLIVWKEDDRMARVYIVTLVKTQFHV